MKNKKVLIILVSIIILLIIAIVAITVGVLTTKKDDDDISTETEWGDKYLVFLKDAKNEDSESREENFGIPEEVTNLKIKFIEVSYSENPVMKISYDLNDEEYVVICYINSEGKISFTSYNTPSKVEYLYNIEQKKYDYYIHSEENEKHSFTSLEKTIATKQEQLSDTENETEIKEKDVTVDYTFTESEMKKDDKFSKFNTSFVEPEIEESEEIDVDLNDKDEELRDKVDSAIDSYKPTADLVTEENKKEVEEKVKEIEDAYLSEEEALKLGRDLYDYGSYPGYYDSKTYTNYLGKSKTPVDRSEDITVGQSGLGNKFGNPKDVEDYFTEKRIKEIGENGMPYGLAKRGNNWYYVQPGIGSDPTHLGELLEVKEITPTKITFTAKTYYAKEMDFLNDTEFQNVWDMSDEERIEAVSKKYECDIRNDDFVIVLEDGHWKIDEQEIYC